MRDPVIVAPLVVAAGLAVGALGIQAHVSETRIATDMGVAWALAAAALVTLGRPRRRRATWLLAAAAFALLGADLEWADTHAWWTLGLVFEQLWIAVLAVLLLALPERRRSSPVTQWAIAGAFTVTLAGQVAGALVEPDVRDLLSVAPHAGAAHAIDRAQEFAGVAVALVVLVLLLRRLRELRGAARRSQDIRWLGPPSRLRSALSGSVW